MKLWLVTLVTLCSVFAAAQDTGTVVVLNVSEHKTGKIALLEGKRKLAKIGQHQWTELRLPVGEHVIGTTGNASEKVVLKIEPGSTQYLLLDMRLLSWLPPVAVLQLRATDAIAGEHWRREFGESKRVDPLR